MGFLFLYDTWLSPSRAIVSLMAQIQEGARMKRRLVTAIVFALIVAVVVLLQDICFAPDGALYIVLAAVFGFIIGGARGKASRDDRAWRDDRWEDHDEDGRGDDGGDD